MLYALLKRWVLTLRLKEETVSEERMPRGSEFQIEGPKWENDLRPKVAVRTEGTQRADVSEEERSGLAGV